MHRIVALGLLGLTGCSAPAPAPALATAPTSTPTPASAPDGGTPPPAAAALPGYTAEGELVRPTGYETWVAVGSSIGLSYSEHTQGDGPGVFHTVYLQPQAFEAYRTTGRFPEKSMLVLALHEPRQRESINKQGYFQGDLVAVEAAVKDRERFAEGWAYFDFGKGGRKASARAKPADACHGCHAAHADDDNVFVQFYPTLRQLRAARHAGPGGD